MVYENCKIYGPYVSKQDGRKRIIVVDQSGTKKTVSYPKYLMECYLDRYLLENETVDHIDSNFTNDEISNLKVLDRKTHCSEDALRVLDLRFICPMCKENFKISGGKQHRDYRNNRLKNCAGPFCSKSCAGKYGAFVQNNYTNKLEIQEIKKSEKYKSKQV